MNEQIAVTLSPEQWNIVGAGLGKLPLEVSGLVYGLIKQQVETAMKPPVKEHSE
jgi:hypothetical protein